MTAQPSLGPRRMSARGISTRLPVQWPHLQKLAHDVVVGEGLALVLAGLDRGHVPKVVAGEQHRRGGSARFRLQGHREPTPGGGPHRHEDRLHDAGGAFDEAQHPAALRSDGVDHAVDHDLRRVDAAVADPCCVPPLPGGEGGVGKDILPAPGGAVDQIVPVVDVKLESDEILALDELAEERFGRRARVAALGGEELDHRRPARPRRAAPKERKGGGGKKRGGEGRGASAVGKACEHGPVLGRCRAPRGVPRSCGPGPSGMRFRRNGCYPIPGTSARGSLFQ